MSHTGAKLRLDPELLAAPFDRLDVGDMTELRDCTVLVDLPEVISVARFVFRSGIGFELLFSPLAEREDFRDAVMLVGSLLLLRVEPWGETESGYQRYRGIYWDTSR